MKSSILKASTLLVAAVSALPSSDSGPILSKPTKTVVGIEARMMPPLLPLETSWLLSEESRISKEKETAASTPMQSVLPSSVATVMDMGLGPEILPRETKLGKQLNTEASTANPTIASTPTQTSIDPTLLSKALKILPAILTQLTAEQTHVSPANPTIVSTPTQTSIDPTLLSKALEILPQVFREDVKFWAQLTTEPTHTSTDNETTASTSKHIHIVPLTMGKGPRIFPQLTGEPTRTSTAESETASTATQTFLDPLIFPPGAPGPVLLPEKLWKFLRVDSSTTATGAAETHNSVESTVTNGKEQAEASLPTTTTPTTFKTVKTSVSQ